MDRPFSITKRWRSTSFPFVLWSLCYIGFVFQIFSHVVNGDSSPPVADVEDLFKDEGFLRMSRGGEAFGRHPQPPPLIIGPQHVSTQPPRHFPTLLPPGKKEAGNMASPGPPRADGGARGNMGGMGDSSPLDPLLRGSGRVVGGGPNNLDLGKNSNDHERRNSENGRLNYGGSASRHSSNSDDKLGQKPLEKDMSAVFSKVPSTDDSQVDSDLESDTHPLLGITPAAPGEAFDFNPILSNPAVTRILAGSSGRIPQWEPTLPDLHDLIPEVNYTAETNGNLGSPSNNNNVAYNGRDEEQQHQQGSGTSYSTSGGNKGHHTVAHNPKNPVFLPSPVSSQGTGTMYNMDQMTNNIAIPKHTLPNPSNLATSRSTITEEESRDHFGSDGVHGSYSDDKDGRKDNHHLHHHHGLHGGSGHSSSGSSHHYNDNHNEDSISPYAYDDDGSSEAQEHSDNQGSRGTWTMEARPHGGVNGNQDQHSEHGPKYIVCDTLCEAWKRICTFTGAVFVVASAACVIIAFIVLYSLHFRLKDFAPFAVILSFLFATSVPRAFTLLSGWFCSPHLRPSWLPIATTVPSVFLTIAFLVTLNLARFPFPFARSYRIPHYSILIISLIALFPTLALSLGAHLDLPNHGVLSQAAWILAHVVLALMSLVYLFKFKSFYTKLSQDRGVHMGGPNNIGSTPLGVLSSPSNGSIAHGANHFSSLKKRGSLVKWGCLQARAMFVAALLALSLSTMIIISVAMNRGECEMNSTWTGWVLSFCARILEFAIVSLLLLVIYISADFQCPCRRLTRVPINKSNVSLMNTDIFPTMVSSNAAVQRCITGYNTHSRADVMMLGSNESRSSLRGKSFGERALPGERLGDYRSSVGRALPIRFSNGPSHSLPGTPVDGDFPQGLKLPEPAPASLLVTKVVFGTPAVSREVNLNHQHENPLLCTGGSSSKEETNNIYASLESVKASMPNAGSSTGSNHSGSDRVLLSAPRDYIYSISRDLTKTIDSIYDTSRPRGNNLAHTIETLCPPLANTIEQIGSIPNLSGSHNGRSAPLNLHPHTLQYPNGPLTPGRTDLTRTIDRIRYGGGGGIGGGGGALGSTAITNASNMGRNFVLQLDSTNQGAVQGVGNPPPYYSSESSHDVTPDSGIVSDIHCKSGRNDLPEVVYTREPRRSSIEDVRRLPLLPLAKHHRSALGSGGSCDRTPTAGNGPPLSTSMAAVSPNNPCIINTGAGAPIYIPSSAPKNTIVGRVESILNQTEHILSRTETMDQPTHAHTPHHHPNAQGPGMQKLMSHKEQLEHVERLLAQAEYAIMLEKRNCVQQNGHHPTSPSSDCSSSHYGYNTSNNSLSNSNVLATNAILNNGTLPVTSSSLNPAILAAYLNSANSPLNNCSTSTSLNPIHSSTNKNSSTLVGSSPSHLLNGKEGTTPMSNHFNGNSGPHLVNHSANLSSSSSNHHSSSKKSCTNVTSSSTSSNNNNNHHHHSSGSKNLEEESVV